MARQNTKGESVRATTHRQSRALSGSHVAHVIQKNTLTPGETRGSTYKKGTSQAHPGVSALNPVNHRNTGYQPLPKPLGLPPYHYDVSEHFPEMAKKITSAGKMVLDVIGDSGGVVNGEYQGQVAEYMTQQLAKNDPDFCYHVGDVVYFTGMHDDYYPQFYEPYQHYLPPIFSISRRSRVSSLEFRVSIRELIC